MKHPQTLAARLFLLTALWAVLSTAVVAWLISDNYRTSVEKNLTERLTANLYNLMGSVSRAPDGKISGRPDLRDSRFQRFQSGYYWSVTEVADADNTLSSTSLVGEAIIAPKNISFDSSFQRQFTIVDKYANTLIGIEAQAFLGDGDNLFSFKITGNQSEVDQRVSEFIRQLLLILSLFALGFILVAFFIVRIGLKPLRSASYRLADIREGRAEKLTGDFPLEIQPLIDETNSLISSNKSVVERARTQVGNLAHSLKTPLAVLKNEGEKARPDLRKIIGAQVNQMQNQVQTYLDRARISARTGSVTSRTNVLPVLERLVRVLAKLNPDLKIDILPTGSDEIIFAGEQQDFEEMVGNLLENACKFAKKNIEIRLQNLDNHLYVSVEDDGKGMSEMEAKRALKRGARLDETMPGSGLGLSIVSDISKEYEGELQLLPSKLGGLKSQLSLPIVNS